MHTVFVAIIARSATQSQKLASRRADFCAAFSAALNRIKNIQCVCSTTPIRYLGRPPHSVSADTKKGQAGLLTPLARVDLHQCSAFMGCAILKYSLAL